MGAGSCATVGREAGKLRSGLAPMRLLAEPQRIETERRPLLSVCYRTKCCLDEIVSSLKNPQIRLVLFMAKSFPLPHPQSN